MRTSEFDRRFEQHNRLFKFFFIGVAGFISLMTALIVAFYVGYGLIAYKTFSYIEENGLKAVVERVWEGETK